MKYFFWPKYHNKIQQLQHWYGQCNSKGMSSSTKWASKLCNCSKFLQLSFAYNPAFYFNIGKKLWRHISSPHVSVITGNRKLPIITKIRFPPCHPRLASSSTFMTDSMYLGIIQIWWNLNEHYCYLISIKSVIWQIDTNCSPLQSLNMLPFYIRLGRLKLIC